MRSRSRGPAALVALLALSWVEGVWASVCPAGMEMGSTAELDALLPEHRQRIGRLMEMHRKMMADMGM